MLLEQIRDIRPGAGNGSLPSSDLANNHKALQNLCIAIIRGKKGQLKTHREGQTKSEYRIVLYRTDKI